MTKILDTDEALRLELREIERRRRAAGVPVQGAAAGPESPLARASRLRLTALCLSGGGIRSAAFCLGILQALAAKRLLNEFDYVSSVSGGGYIAGWLQMWYRQRGDAAAAQDELGSSVAEPVRRLRGFANYLTPQTGPFSADTWAGIMLYLRNLLLNWVVFLPLLLLLALVPISYRTGLAILRGYGGVDFWLLIAAALCLVTAVFFACTALPSHRAEGDFATPQYIQSHIIVPATAWAFLLPFAIDFALPNHRHIPDFFAAATPDWLRWLDQHHLVIPTLYVIVCCVGYFAAAVVTAFRPGGQHRLYIINMCPWLAASVTSALLLWGGLNWLHPGSALANAASRQLFWKGHAWLVNRDTAITVCTPLWLIGMHTLHSTVYVGLRREAEFADLDREWLARLSGWFIRIGLAWTLLALCCLVLPVALPGLTAVGEAQPVAHSLAAMFGSATLLGGAAAWLGKQVTEQLSATAAKVGGWLVWLTSALTSGWLLITLATVFAILLLDVVATLGGWLLGQAADALRQAMLPNGATAWCGIPADTLSTWMPIAIQFGVAGFAALAIRGFGDINVNRFSMHAVYRNRLTRAFLGTARAPARRQPDPFTGFAMTEGIGGGPAAPPLPISDDNPRLKDFVHVPNGQRLYPVINMTLNVTAGSNTAWAERQGESFVATPWVCGAAELRHPDQISRNDLDRPLGAFVMTKRYAGKETLRTSKGRNQGLRIGSAMTISGAAVSPNWGYHTSRITALLMMLFNVRLGAWLPNPAMPLAAVPPPDQNWQAGRAEWQRARARRRQTELLQLAGPHHSLAAFINELLGAATDDKQAIYLSDGGHFENLGVYEMLRRRCRSIVVIDAGQDGNFAFFDLGNAIRKSEIDLGVRVRMRTMHLYPRSTIDSSNPADALVLAVGDIVYPGSATGQLVYFKPTLLPSAPAEVRAYARDDDAFPHVTTAEQWFTESEFESYRALGAWQAQRVIDTMVGADLRSFFDAAFAMCPP